MSSRELNEQRFFSDKNCCGDCSFYRNHMQNHDLYSSLKLIEKFQPNFAKKQDSDCEGISSIVK